MDTKAKLFFLCGKMAAGKSTLARDLAERENAILLEWYSPKVLEAEINRSSTFLGVAESGSHGIVGMVTAYSDGDILSIARLYVLPELQGQGIGEALMGRELPYVSSSTESPTRCRRT